MEKFEPHFDARAELKNIRHLDDNEKELPKDERLKLRKERLEDIKKKLADQMMGIAETNAGLKSFVFSGDALTSEKLNDFLEKSTSVHKFAPWQIAEYEAAIEKIVERNSLVNNFFLENCEGKSGEEIFEYIFNRKPCGKILIEKGALCLIIFCEGEDFFYIHSLPDAEIIESSDIARKLENVGGFALHLDEKAPAKFADFGNSLMIIKGIKPNDAEIIERITHESRHIFDNLVFPNEKKAIHSELIEQVAVWQENLAKISDGELSSLSAEDVVRLFVAKPIEMQVDAMRRVSEATAKEEILAYYQQGVEHSYFYSLFSSSHNDGLYAVIDERTRQAYGDHLIKTIAGGEQEKAIVIELYRKMHSREEELYKKHLSDATQAISRLEKIGISRDEIIGLFETEPLENWDKIFERIKKSDVYSKKHSMYQLKQYLEGVEYNIEGHKETIAEALQQLGEPSEKNHLYRFWQNYHKQKYATYEEALKFFLESNKKYLEDALARKNELEQQISELEK